MAREDLSFHSAAVATLCTVILAVGSSAALADDSTGRRPNAHETFYQYVALQLGEAGMCEKISRSAILPGGFFMAASYARSVCFDRVARKLGQVALCARVDRLGAMTWLDDQTSSWSCRRAIWSKGPDPSLSTYMPSQEDLVRIFAEMGYRPDELHRDGLTAPLAGVKDAYRRLGQQPDLLARIGKATDGIAAGSLPAGARQRSPELIEYLFEMAAHVGNDVSWCLKISEAALDPDVEAAARSPRLYWRDRCLLELASNNYEEAWCRLIPDRPDDRRSPLLTTKAACVRQAGRPRGDSHRYAFRAPRSEDDARTLIKLLGYPLPDVRDVPGSVIASTYLEYIWALSLAKTPDEAAARQRLIERTKALPDFK